jgi:hypothetical protein
MIRYFIVESSNAEVGPSITGVHKNQTAAEVHMDTIRRNFRKAGHEIAENTDTCFTVTKDGSTSTFALHGIHFD